MDKLSKILGKPKKKPSMVVEVGAEPIEDDEDEDLGIEALLGEPEEDDDEPEDPAQVLDSIERGLSKLRGMFG